MFINSPHIAPKMNEIEAAMQETAHGFAKDIMRPVGIQLDRMTPSEVIAADSPFWTVRKQYLELGLDLQEISQDLTPEQYVRCAMIVNEELGWGDLGLAFSMYGLAIPTWICKFVNRPDLLEQFGSSRGCWGLTEPDHGSDMVDFTHSLSPDENGGLKSNCRVTRKGDKLVINGQKSAWVSNASIAECMALFCRYDDGSGKPARGAFMVPLDLEGVSRSEPILRHGMRGLTDAEVYFDNVEIPLEYMLAGPDEYDVLVGKIISTANPGMGVFMVGLARAAYEMALDYSKERTQGGSPIFDYQTVKLKLFHMFRKIEYTRALTRHVLLMSVSETPPAFQLCASVKVTSTEMAIEVANSAFDLFGGNAQTQDYQIEKLVRDARLGTIADGTNDVLGLMASSFL